MKNYCSHTSAKLVELLCHGDEQAFSEIYNRYWKRLFAIAYNRLKEVETAEDVVHDVLSSLWANREKTEVASLENYLASAVKYHVLSKIKRKVRERRINKVPHQTPVIEMPVETSMHCRRILGIIKTEVEKLPEKCKLIFKYSRELGLPVKQIANKMHISPKTVENQLNKALKQLKSATRSFLHLL